MLASRVQGRPYDRCCEDEEQERAHDKQRHEALALTLQARQQLRQVGLKPAGSRIGLICTGEWRRFEGRWCAWGSQLWQVNRSAVYKVVALWFKQCKQLLLWNNHSASKASRATSKSTNERPASTHALEVTGASNIFTGPFPVEGSSMEAGPAASRVFAARRACSDAFSSNSRATSSRLVRAALHTQCSIHAQQVLRVWPVSSQGRAKARLDSCLRLVNGEAKAFHAGILVYHMISKASRPSPACAGCQTPPLCRPHLHGHILEGLKFALHLHLLLVQCCQL